MTAKVPHINREHDWRYAYEREGYRVFRCRIHKGETKREPLDVSGNDRKEVAVGTGGGAS